MSSTASILAETETIKIEEGSSGIRIPLRDYIPFVQSAMDNQGMSRRQLALRTGIRRERVSNILKIDNDPDHHHRTMTLVELQMILHVLGIEFMQAVLRVEAVHDMELLLDGRYSSMFNMVGEVCKELPLLLVQALNDVEGMDGTEIRREWATPLNTGVVEKVVREVVATIARRATLRSVNDLGLNI